MKNLLAFPQRAVKHMAAGLLTAGCLAWFAPAASAQSIPTAGAFVEPLAQFISVDTRVEPISGTTYVLGRNESNQAILLKYDSSGAQLVWDSGASRVFLNGITPNSLAIGPGGTNLYVVGGGMLYRVDTATGTAINTNGAAVSWLNLQSVYFDGTTVYVAGNFTSTTSQNYLGRTLQPRGSQAGVIVKFTADLATVTGSMTFGNSGGGSLNTANSLVVDDSGDIYVGGRLGTGAFTSEAFTSGAFNVLYRHRASGINSLQDAQAVLNGDYNDTLQTTRANMCGIGTLSDNGDHNYIWQEKGIFEAPTAAQYTFTSTTDDGSWLYIDGKPVIYDNTGHPQTSFSGTISLFAGLHSIDWLYWNGSGPGNGSLSVSGGGLAGCVTPADFTAHANTSYVLKFAGDFSFMKNAYFTTATTGTGGEINELTYSQGWIYAIGHWNGLANNININPVDRSVAGSQDVDILKLDTGLQLKARATVKGAADNTGFSISADEAGNAYLTGTYGTQSADFFGSSDPTNKPFTSISSSKLNLFIAQLDSNFAFKWVNKPSGTPPNFSFPTKPRVRWNSVLQRAFWTGYFDAGTLQMGNSNLLQSLDGPKGFLAVLDPDGKFTERVNLTVVSDFGNSGTQVKPFGGPAANTNSLATIDNTRPVIKGAQITVSVPSYLYRDINSQDITISDADASAAADKINRLAETRIGCLGYSVGENVANGVANTYTFTLSKDTIVKFNWLVEHALRIKADFSATAGTDSQNASGHITGLISEAAGTPVPAVQKHWVAANETVIASIDSAVDDIDYASRGLPVRYVVTGYDAYGPPNTLGGADSTNSNFIKFLGNDIRRQVPQFLMTGPASITYHWKLKIGVSTTTTGLKSVGFPLVKILSDPGQVVPPKQSDGTGSGTFYYDENTSLRIATLKNQGTTQLKGWLNGDGTVFPTSGSLSNLVTEFTVTNNGVVATYICQPVNQLKRPARVVWDYGDRIFEETVFIGNSVTFNTVDDAAVKSILRMDTPPERADLVNSPAGSTSADMAIWDGAGKKYYPLRPGTVYSYWYTAADPSDRVIIKLNFKYPVASHYRHIAGTPPVNLDPSTNDLVSFKALKYSETGTGAAVDNDKKFTASGPGKTVLLFGQTSSSGRGGVIETLRVRVVETKNWNDQLPSTQTAIIGSKITSAYDTAGLGTGYAFFKNARYNAAIYDRDNLTGPIIPVNLNPTATTEEQLVVVWYENRDKIIWPYQSVRYQPAWPTLTTGLNRIVIASRYGNESVAADGADQVVAEEENIGTNTYPAEYAFNPARFQQVQIYNQPNRTLPGYNPNEEHALLAPSLRSAAISPRPMAAYALRDGDLNSTNRDATYTSDPYVLVQFFDALDQEFKMKVYNIVRADSNLSLGDLSYDYKFEQEMAAGEPVIPFYPLPQVIGATPCGGSYGRDGQPTKQLCYWKDHKGTAWAVSGGSFFYGYYFYPLLPDFYWPPTDNKQAGDCVAFLPDVARFSGESFANINYTKNDQVPAAQGIRYTTVWPQNVPILKVGETLTFPGGEYAVDHPTTTVTTDSGDVVSQATEGLPGILAFAAGQIVYDTMNPVMNDQTNFTKYTARIFPALEERTVPFSVDQLPSALTPANGRTSVKNGVYVFKELPSSLQKRMFYDPIRGKLGIKGFLNDKDISDSTLTASPPAVYVLEPNVITLAEKQILNGSAKNSPFADLAGTPFAQAMDKLYNLTRNPNSLDQGGNGVDQAYRVGLEQKVKVDPSNGKVLTTTSGGITTVQRDATKAAPLQALGPGLAMVANPDFLDPSNSVQISYVTVAENNSDALGGSPVILHIIKVDKTQRYRGAIKTVLSDNVFDENIILRHTADFGGNADDLVFEWWYRPEDGTEALTPDRQPSPTPWKLFADPTGNDGVGFYQLTLKGNPSAPEVLLADTLFYLRYRHKNEVTDGIQWEVPQKNGERRCLLNVCTNGIPYDWAGAGNSSVLDIDGDGQPDYRPQLAEGWIKRVLSRVNPYEARINDFSADNPATYSSMIQQLGAAYTGPVALNPDKNVIENVGLIALYETIFKRGKDLSIDLSTPISTPSIANALQLASTRLSDFYRLLGNEAYSDAQDPTIGYGSSSVEYGSLAPTIFAFQNQMSSLLDQELALLRGVDDYNGAPVNNRLYWNFTHAEGEAAYAMKYNISDINKDGFIDVKDAMTLYPQGHGDAWGHYLTAQTYQYDLLRHPYFNWVSRSEYINSQDVVIRVDYLDERKFAQTAAAKAQAGAEIVNMTYRDKYVADPNSQWQGYTDTDANRAWGVEEWAHRVGQSTYFDWVTANALLPAQHPNTNYVGVQKVDRTTVRDIATVAANLTAVQTTMEQVDGGNNPLGIANGAVPFTFDPNFLIVGSGVQGQTFFNQTYIKAVGALNNALVTFNNANQLNNMIRQIANSETEFRQSVYEQDLAYRNQLIEIFGTPYEGTIGSGKAFPAGFQGPDTMLYMYVPVNQVNNKTVPRPPLSYYNDLNNQISGSSFVNGLASITDVPNNWKEQYKISLLDKGNVTNSVNFTDFSNTNKDPVAATLDNLNLPVMASGYTFVAPSSWGIRTSPGELQSLISQMVQAQADLSVAISDWNSQLQEMKVSISGVQAKYDNYKYQYGVSAGKIALDTALESIKLGFVVASRIADYTVTSIDDIKDATGEFVPKNLPTAGLAFSPGDALAPARGGTKIAADVASAVIRSIKLTTESFADGTDIAKNLADAIIELEKYRADQGTDLILSLQEIQKMARGEASSRLDIFSKVQALSDLSNQYRAKLAQGNRLIQERTAFNQRVAAQTQQNRYQDIAFRYSRNAALEKYRSSFDLAARYVYLAASAYDYDLNLGQTDPGSPAEIMADIVRQRTIGIMEETPQVGGGGLAEDLAKLKSNYDVLMARMGLNNPQYELTTFSLRSEAFRILSDTNSDDVWRQTLRGASIYKNDLWQVPEFRRYCRPFAPESAGPQPGLVIELNTCIQPGVNFFGFPLGGGDHAYDPTVFATRIHGVSVTFDGYDSDNLSASPRAYLIPVGSDIMTVPNSSDRTLRTWNVIDQNMPIPYPATTANLDNNSWRPAIDTVNNASGAFGDIRKYSSFLATSDSVDGLGFNTVQDLRLIGRSVWNTRWLLIIPGASLNYDATTGLDNFINSLTDIKLTIDSYGYSGN